MTPEAQALIVLAGLFADREHKGTKWCMKHGIGKRREIIGTALPLPHLKITDGSVAAYASAQRQAAQLLATECRRCRGCKLGREEQAA